MTAHPARQRLSDGVEYRTVGVWTVWTEPGDGTINQLRVDRLQAGVIGADLFHHARPRVADQGIGAADQPVQYLPASGHGIVQCARSLVAIVRLKLRAVETVLVGPELVALRRPFDLDDVRTHLGQQQRREWSGDESAEVQNSSSLQHLHAVISPSNPSGPRSRCAAFATCRRQSSCSASRGNGAAC